MAAREVAVSSLATSYAVAATDENETALKLGDYAVTEAGFGADLGADAVEHRRQQRLVVGQRRLREGLAGKDDEADPIAHTAQDVVADDLFGDEEAVFGPKVGRPHRARDVESDED